MITWEWLILAAIAPAAASAVLTFFITKKLFKRELKKNPPINEKTIRMLYSQIGRKPSEQQIKSMMNSINKQLK